MLATYRSCICTLIDHCTCFAKCAGKTMQVMEKMEQAGSMESALDRLSVVCSGVVAYGVMIIVP